MKIEDLKEMEDLELSSAYYRLKEEIKSGREEGKNVESLEEMLKIIKSTIAERDEKKGRTTKSITRPVSHDDEER